MPEAILSFGTLFFEAYSGELSPSGGKDKNNTGKDVGHLPQSDETYTNEPQEMIAF